MMMLQKYQIFISVSIKFFSIFLHLNAYTKICLHYTSYASICFFPHDADYFYQQLHSTVRELIVTKYFYASLRLKKLKDCARKCVYINKYLLLVRLIVLILHFDQNRNFAFHMFCKKRCYKCFTSCFFFLFRFPFNKNVYDTTSFYRYKKNKLDTFST